MSPSRWNVLHELRPFVPYGNGPVEFADRGVRLIVADGQITRVEHTLTLPDNAAREDAEAISRDEMDGLLVALRFLQARPMQWYSNAVPLDAGGLIMMAGHATVTVGPRPVDTPLAGWYGADAGTLASWLHFAAEAQEATSPATALRLYGLIVEDWREAAQLPAEPQPDFVRQLMAVRDFVSHPEIDREPTRNTLRACAPELTAGPDAFRYRPSNQDQRRVLEVFRQRARAYVDAELNRRLGV